MIAMPAGPFRHRVTALLAGCLAVAALPASSLRAAGPSQATGFQPPGMWIWDNWFVREGDTWHAFYLQLPKAVGADRRWKNNDFYKHVGHATSTDLTNWQDQGPALGALSGTWNDRHIATGSIIRHDNRWWMFFTGRGTQGDGVGLALSDDLMTWKTEPAPLFPLIDTFAEKADQQFTSTWQGQSVRWAGISDPYILPEAHEGWFYIVLCSRVLDVPIGESGCLTLLRSRDLKAWQDPQIVAWPRCFERMETPQLWQRQSRWYLSFGGVLNKDWLTNTNNASRLPSAAQGKTSHQNYCYTMKSLQGPADEAESSLQFIDVPKGHFIMKVLSLSKGEATGQEDVALFTMKSEVGTAMSPLYAVKYGDDGKVELTVRAK